HRPTSWWKSISRVNRAASLRFTRLLEFQRSGCMTEITSSCFNGQTTDPMPRFRQAASCPTLLPPPSPRHSRPARLKVIRQLSRRFEKGLEPQKRISHKKAQESQNIFVTLCSLWLKLRSVRQYSHRWHVSAFPQTATEPGWDFDSSLERAEAGMRRH